MRPRPYFLATAAVFGVVALLHAARALYGWEAEIGSWAVPMWISWAALVVSGSLALWGLRLARRP